jgi:hypothetical protein
MYPDHYLGVDGYQRRAGLSIQRAKADGYRDAPGIDDYARKTEVSRFVDPVTGLVHNHELNKHTLRATFDVQGWVIHELDHSEFDHAGVNELWWRQMEFIADGRDVFCDTEDDDESRWDEIESTAERAIISSSVSEDLRAKFGSPPV